MNRRLSDVLEFSKTLTLLIVEDEEIVLKQLEKSFSTIFTNILSARNGQEATELYFAYHEKNGKFIDIIFTDLNLPILNGLDFCERIKPYNEKQIIIATSAYADVNDLQKIIDLGIYKFIPKPINFSSMFDTIVLSLEKIKEEQKILELKKELNYMKSENLKLFEAASLDKLTELYNRRYTDDILEKYKNSQFCIIFVDIDNFKSINDTYGHKTGDEVLIEFANILKSHTRSYDIVGRWGGEEFVIILKDTLIDTTLFIAEKLRKTIEDAVMYNDIKITSSFGISVFEKGDKLIEVLEDADKNLYYAKKEGKNKISLKYKIYGDE